MVRLPRVGVRLQRMSPTTEGTQVPARAGMVFNPATGNADGSGRQAFSTNGRVNVVTPAAPMSKLLSYIPLAEFRRSRPDL